jgi:hypothetical protein
VVFEVEVPGKVPGSKAIYRKEVDYQGNTVSITKTTIDPKGEVVHEKDKSNPKAKATSPKSLTRGSSK